MGALKLTYRSKNSSLKVVHRFFSDEEKSWAGAYKYGFNGMERDDEIKGSGNSYDFGARIYDPRVGRWLSLDPLMKKYPSLSPYNYVNNSPTNYIDYDGRDFGYKIVHNDKGGTITIKATYYTSDANSQSTADAVKFYQDQNGKFEYQVEEENGNILTYDIVFELDIQETVANQVDNAEYVAQEKAYDDNTGNSFVERTGDTKPKDRGMTTYGRHIFVDSKKKVSTTGIHEVGHTLGQPNHIGTYTNIQASGETRFINSKEFTVINVAKIISNFGLVNDKQMGSVPFVTFENLLI